MPAVLIALEPHQSGDTWPGIPVIGPVIINDAQPGAALASARLNFVPIDGGSPAIRLGTEEGANAPIIIVNAATWELSIPPVDPEIFNLPAGDYIGQLETTDASGEVLTLYTLTLTVNPDYTV